jgi:hypothetical protein
VMRAVWPKSTTGSDATGSCATESFFHRGADCCRVVQLPPLSSQPADEAGTREIGRDCPQAIKLLVAVFGISGTTVHGPIGLT